MTATLRNLTGMSVAFSGQTLPPAPQPLGCADALPAPIAGSYFLVPACMAGAAHARMDIIWSNAIPRCGACTVARPSKRGWRTQFGRGQATTPTLLVVEHYTPEEGRQGVGLDYFRQRYLQ